MHICVRKLTSIGSDNVIIWLNAGIFKLETLGTNFIKTFIAICIILTRSRWLNVGVLLLSKMLPRCVRILHKKIMNREQPTERQYMDQCSPYWSTYPTSFDIFIVLSHMKLYFGGKVLRACVKLLQHLGKRQESTRNNNKAQLRNWN